MIQTMLQQCCFFVVMWSLFLAVWLITTPEEFDKILKAVCRVLQLVVLGLLIFVSFSVASLVFFVMCMRIGDEGPSFEESLGLQQPFWTWDCWG